MGHIKGLISCNFGRPDLMNEWISFSPIERELNTCCVWRAKCLPYSRCLAYVDSSRIGVCLLHRTPPCVIIFEWLCLVVGLGFWSSYNLVLDATRHPWSYWCCLLGFNHQTILFLSFILLISARFYSLESRSALYGISPYQFGIRARLTPLSQKKTRIDLSQHLVIVVLVTKKKATKICELCADCDPREGLPLKLGRLVERPRSPCQIPAKKNEPKSQAKSLSTEYRRPPAERATRLPSQIHARRPPVIPTPACLTTTWPDLVLSIWFIFSYFG